MASANRRESMRDEAARVSQPRQVASRTKVGPFHEYLTTTGPGKNVLTIQKGETIFRQGDPANSVFYIQKGRAKIGVTSSQGKEATLALQGRGDFIGEECIVASQPLRMATATAMLPCTVLRIDYKELERALDADKSLARIFQSHLLSRCVLMQADLIDHLFNSSEKRLARTLLLLAQLEDKNEATTPCTTQEALAEIVGTTRSRVNIFMNRFRKLGHIEYGSYNSGVKVYRSLFHVLLRD